MDNQRLICCAPPAFPAPVYIADAVGIQTEAVVVRGLSLEVHSLGPLLLGELATGVLIGLPLALLAVLGIFRGFQDLTLASGVGLALFATSNIASLLSLLFPWPFARFGFDPAFGSGPCRHYPSRRADYRHLFCGHDQGDRPLRPC